MRLTIRSKLILYTVVPVVAVYSLLFAFGVVHVRDQLADGAQRLLLEHARHQAARLSLAVAQAPELAESVGDLVLAAPDQPQALLYAHLIDGLRRTPLASAAAVAFGTPRRSALLRRDGGTGRQLRADEQLVQAPGWHPLPAALGYSRPLWRAGERIGTVWVELSTAEVYAELERLREPPMRLLVRRSGGGVVMPPQADRRLTEMAMHLPSDLPGEQVHALQVAGREHWLIEVPLPGQTWRVTALIPAADALADTQREASLLAGGLLLSLLVVVAIISAVARQITRPLAVLDDAVEHISRGDLAVAPRVDTDDELADLARAIGQMAGHVADRERQLRTAQQALEQRVSERTAELQQSNVRLRSQIEETRKTEEALRLASAQAQQANRAKSEFLSNMSHELRTPLHGVLGYTQILRRDPHTPPGQQASLVAIERCGQHLLTLINDILDLTRIEAGRIRVDQRPTDLAILLEEVRSIVAQRAAHKGLVLQTLITSELPRGILTDPVRLKQILLNLLDNAIKFTASGSVVLSVTREHDDWLRFSVADSGTGIPEDSVEAIFDAFHQASEGRAVDGTGLGLTINQRLLRLLGGEAMLVESHPGEGSRFSFRLPCRPTDDVPLSTPQAPLGRRLADGRPCAVLVLDELDDHRRVLATLLRQAGCSVTEADSDAAAAAQLADQRFDVAFIDVDLSAAKLAQRCATLLQSAQQAPLMIAVGAPAGSAVADQPPAGCDGFIGKPFDAARVLDEIERLLPLHFVAKQDPPPTSSQWPAALAANTAARVRAAVELGDVGSLFALAEELAEHTDVSQQQVEQLAQLVRLFDFDGLLSLCDRLETAQ